MSNAPGQNTKTCAPAAMSSMSSSVLRTVAHEAIVQEPVVKAPAVHAQLVNASAVWEGG